VPIVGPEQAAEVARALCAGAIVAIPTDTVYGLAALPTDATAVARLVELKGRGAGQPIAMLFDAIEAVAPYLDDPAALERVRRFWPGALTAVVRAKAGSGLVPPVIAKAGTVGVRQPDDELTRRVLRGCGGVLAATSANRHGEPPTTSAAEVVEAFGATMAVLDGGPRSGGLPSTVVDLTVEPPRVLREGAVSAEALGVALGLGTGMPRPNV
jgi:tRNA threonylcarbamoyl adenosine modification protein (Sua5/YciO/YrdC/YwlC family)